MDFVELLKMVANTRVKVAFLVGVAVVTCFPHAFIAASTHMGLPSATTLLVSSFWPAIAACLLYVTYQFLPRGIIWALQVLGPNKRRWNAAIIGTCILAVSLVAVLVWPEEPIVTGAARLVLLAAAGVGAIALMLAASGLQPRIVDRLGDPKLHNDIEVAAHARAATNTLVLSSAAVALLLAWNAMARLPLAAGGLRGPCVRVAVSAADLPAGVREVLLGKLAQKSALAGSELTLPAWILRKDATETFLWMGTGHGVTIPFSRIGAIQDFDEATNGCSMSDAQIEGELGKSKLEG